MENLNFIPDEHSYVEPWIEAKEDIIEQQPTSQVELPELDEDSQKLLKKDPKKLTAAEKKKLAEIESSRKQAEEDSKAQEISAES